MYFNFQHVIINLLNNMQELEDPQEFIIKFLSNPAMQGIAGNLDNRIVCSGK